ncbi:complement C3-like [Antennarius striatus]|uniref:complement C3-like n=1 Tax=Antennarius striatus TaxID=241820 RepID=UPI0035B392E6
MPTFEVKLSAASNFFSVDSKDLTINIRATYLIGKEVEGMAYALFGFMEEDNKRSFPASIQMVQIIRGDGEVRLNLEHITQTFPDIMSLVGRSIFVAVTVLTDNGVEMVEAQLRGIKIVTSPYLISFKKTPRYYKPRMSFDVALEVVYSDGTPAQGVAVVVDPGREQGRTDANGIAKVSINTDRSTDRLTVTAKTRDPLISPERQSSASLAALPFTTKSRKYIHIAVEAAEAEVGQNLKISGFLSSKEDGDLTYLVLSRGQLLNYGRYQINNQPVISLTLHITKHMLPSFRLVVYYHTKDNEVVSDSAWVPVKDICMGTLKLEPTRPGPLYAPRSTFPIKVTGDPGATVGLVAVNKGVYALNNKHRLTQRKVWDILEVFDTGCTPGGGQDSMGVFHDAGLLFESSASGTPVRHGDSTLLPSPTLLPELTKRESCGTPLAI